MLTCPRYCSFFFNDTATTEIYTLSLHDALPIYHAVDCHARENFAFAADGADARGAHRQVLRDRKSTRLNSSHSQISYAVFCLKKKKNYKRTTSSRSQTRWSHSINCLSRTTISTS